MSRLSIEVTTEQHQQIKTLAVLQGKSIKSLILEKLFPTTEENIALIELENLLRHIIKDAKKGSSSFENFSQISKAVLDSSK